MERQLSIADAGVGKGWAAHRRSAFTLIELLVVIAIVGILMTLAIPSVRAMLDSSNLTRAGQLVGDQVNLARQIASASSSTIEVRFVKLPSVAKSGYCAIQIWGANRKGAVAALRNVVQLPAGSVISEDSTLSPAFSTSLQRPLPKGVMPGGTGPTAGTSYISFQVRPSGIVLPVLAMKDFSVTVVPVRFADASTLPANYVTIQVNPLTASPFMYRP